jgi:hypothetical protein
MNELLQSFLDFLSDTGVNQGCIELILNRYPNLIHVTSSGLNGGVIMLTPRRSLWFEFNSGVISYEYQELKKKLIAGQTRNWIDLSKWLTIINRETCHVNE